MSSETEEEIRDLDVSILLGNNIVKGSYTGSNWDSKGPNKSANGKFTFKNGDVYDGQFRETTRNDEESVSIIYGDEYSEGIFTYGSQVNENGFKFYKGDKLEGNFGSNAGLRDGTFKLTRKVYKWYRKESIKESILEFKHNILVTHYEGGFENPTGFVDTLKPSGKGTLSFYDNGLICKLVGEWVGHEYKHTDQYTSSSVWLWYCTGTMEFYKNYTYPATLQAQLQDKGFDFKIGDKLEGKWVDNKLHGYYKLTHKSNKSSESILRFNNDKLWTKYEGDFNDDTLKPSGKGTMIFFFRSKYVNFSFRIGDKLEGEWGIYNELQGDYKLTRRNNIFNLKVIDGNLEVIDGKLIETSDSYTFIGGYRKTKRTKRKNKKRRKNKLSRKNKKNKKSFLRKNIRKKKKNKKRTQRR